MTRTLLPPNSTKLELAAEVSMAKAFDLPVQIDKLWSAEECPLELLPYLAWALSVDTWNTAWSEKVKRQVIASAAYVHKFKGTPAGIKAALKALDLGVELSEWFEHGGDPYTFQVDVFVTTRGIDAAELESIRSTIINTKNARSWLSRLRVYLTSEITCSKGVIAQRGRVSVVNPFQPIFHPICAHPRTAFSVVRQRTSIVEPLR